MVFVYLFVRIFFPKKQLSNNMTIEVDFHLTKFEITGKEKSKFKLKLLANTDTHHDM